MKAWAGATTTAALPAWRRLAGLALTLGVLLAFGADRASAQFSPPVVGSGRSHTVLPDLAASSQGPEGLLWTHQISIKEATFLKPHFVGVDLRPGDVLVVRAASGRVVEEIRGRGPKDWGSFWGLSGFGNTMTLEFSYDAPYSVPPFSVDEIIVGDLDLLAPPPEPGPESICSPADFEDVICYQGDAGKWANVQASVGVMSLSGNPNSAIFCSGSNISPNNLVLTNHHCIESQSECNSAEFVFKFYRTGCNNGSPTTTDWQSFRCDEMLAFSPFGPCDANLSNLDFSLHSVIGDPAATFGFAQPDPTPITSGEAVYMVQHPAGRPHEITHGSGPDFEVDGTVLRYFDTLDSEGGSSGSPLFREADDLLIGLHHCGGCSSTTGNRGMLMSDIYPLISGLLEPSFTLEGTNLDQELCVGDAPLDLLDVNVDVGETLGFSNPVTLSYASLPASFSGSFSQNPVVPPGQSLAEVDVDGTVTAGSYSFQIEGSAAAAPNRSITVDVEALDLPAAASPTTPADGASQQRLDPVLAWGAGAGATDYDLEVDDDPAFGSIDYAASVSGTSHTVLTPLTAATTYYWRVRSQNVCGIGPDSSVSSFTTANLICGTSDIPIPNDDPQGVTDTLVLAQSGGIDDLDLFLTATHGWVGDLVFVLTHLDTGTSATLIDLPGAPAMGPGGCPQDDIDVILDDGGSSPVENQCSGSSPAIRGVRIPNEALDAFRGEDLSGSWIFHAIDLGQNDAGVMNSWCLAPAYCDDGLGTTAPAVAPLPSSPADGATDLFLGPSFAWQAVPGASEYELEVDDDPGFGSLDYAVTVFGTSHSAPPVLAGATPYSWRVRASNVCGLGPDSAVSTFTTADLLCSSPGVAIPNDSPPGITVNMPVTESRLIADLDVLLQVPHSSVGDLIFELTHVDTGTSATLIDLPGAPALGPAGCLQEDIDVRLDDDAASPAEDECSASAPAIGGVRIPSDALAIFQGEDLNGTWSLHAVDLGLTDVGTLDTWCLAPQPGACDNGLDDDGDGLIDFDLGMGDLGCASASDPSERDDTGAFPCDNGLDDDGDGRADFDPATLADAPSHSAGFGDPGCNSPIAPLEDPQCQDGIDNDDIDLLTDFDGGQSIHGACSGGTCPPGVSDPDLDGVADPDPQCAGTPWKAREKSGCGLGVELVFVLLPLLRARRRAASI